MGIPDLIAVAIVVVGAVVCFLIWSGHQTYVEELGEELEELEAELTKKQAMIDDLTRVTTANAKEFAIFRGNVQTRLNMGPK